MYLSDNHSDARAHIRDGYERLKYCNAFSNYCLTISHSTAGVKYVRGGEVFEMRDEENVPLNDPFR